MSKVTCLILLFLAAASAQRGKSGPTQHPTTVYSQVPFDISATQLPPHFRGHDIEALYHAFATLGPRKDEYETTEQYSQRVAATLLKPVIGSITPKSLLAFVVQADFRPYFFSQYDADNSILNTEVDCSITPNIKEVVMRISSSNPFLRPNVPDPLKGCSVVITFHERTTTGVGSNVFGATAKVSRNSFEFYGVFWNNNIVTSRYQHSIHADPQIARRTNETLSALVVCSLNNDFPELEVGSHSPATLDSPVEEITDKFLLNTTLLAVWFFDSSTGTVYAKIEPPK